MSAKFFILVLFFALSLSAKERIISLSPSIAEIVFALKKGDSLVGVSSYSLYPKEVQKLPIIGGYTNPNLEKILALSPTLVVGQTFNIHTLEQLKRFHIKTLMLDLKTISSIKNSIKTLSDELNSQEGEKLLNNIDKAIQNIKKTKTPHSVMIVYGLKEDLRSGIYIAGHNIFFEDIIHFTGNTNAYRATSTAQPVLNYENVIALNPEQIIILHSRASEPDVDVKKALASWYKLPTDASKNKRISIIDEDYLHIPSHRVAQTIKRLSSEMSYD